VRQRTDCRLQVFSVILLVFALAAIAPRRSVFSQTPSSDNQAGGSTVSSFWSANACFKCHQPHTTTFAKSRHGRAMEFGGSREMTCDTCHGDGTEHTAKEGKAPIKNPPDLPRAEEVALCMSCHAGGGPQFWDAHAHGTSNISCRDCHSDHNYQSPEKLLLKRNETELCTVCHPAVRKAVLQRSTHLFRNERSDVRISCASCHEPHGSGGGDKLLRAASVNDTCYECHQEKRGPFLWEHSPARENCSNCHTPHGSNNPGLLTQRTTFICQSCHLQGRHQTVAGRMNSTWLINRGCLNCHPMIHGSNHPSGVLFHR
jgi:DmsE family decaheme c-type cytochrome